MSGPDGIERRRRFTVADCAERYERILEELRGVRGDFNDLRAEVKPVLEIYRASTMGGRALVKLVGFIGAVSAIVFGWLKFRGGA